MTILLILPTIHTRTFHVSYIIWYCLILLFYGNLSQRPFGPRFPKHKHPTHLEMRSAEVAVICNDYMVPIVTLEIKTLPNSFSRILAGHRCPPTSAKSVSNHMTIGSEIVMSIHFNCLLIRRSIPCLYVWYNTWFHADTHTHTHPTVMVASACMGSKVHVYWTNA